MQIGELEQREAVESARQVAEAQLVSAQLDRPGIAPPAGMEPRQPDAAMDQPTPALGMKEISALAGQAALVIVLARQPPLQALVAETGLEQGEAGEVRRHRRVA